MFAITFFFNTSHDVSLDDHYTAIYSIAPGNVTSISFDTTVTFCNRPPHRYPGITHMINSSVTDVTAHFCIPILTDTVTFPISSASKLPTVNPHPEMYSGPPPVSYTHLTLPTILLV